MELPPDKAIPPDFNRTLKKNVWNKIDRTFFMVRQKRRAKLYSVGHTDPGPKKIPKSS
jgi:hypothetical protein